MLLGFQEHEVEYWTLLPELQATSPSSTSIFVGEVLFVFVPFLYHGTYGDSLDLVQPCDALVKSCRWCDSNWFCVRLYTSQRYCRSCNTKWLIEILSQKSTLDFKNSNTIKYLFCQFNSVIISVPDRQAVRDSASIYLLVWCYLKCYLSYISSTGNHLYAPRECLCKCLQITNSY